ncbi:MAG: DNA polymerase III subunit gamma/tau [Thermodesulfovibrionales bacterium]
MSYLVLARKWRPRGFDDLVGQEPITRVLMNAIRQGRIPHAYIFSGPRGVGKTSTARILAKALNCEHGPTPTPCGSCRSCASVGDGSSVDVSEIDGASNNSVDDIRDLRERVKYAPSGARYKVYIIDEVHMLSTPAFNALLKTLEEPPPHVIFVLATTEMRKIPATIISRCQHMPFRRIPSAVIKARLAKIAETEQISISPHALGLVARAADGSMRDSLTILDQVSSFTSEITEEAVQNLLGLTDFPLLAGMARALLTGDRSVLIETVNVLAEQGMDFRSFFRDLVQFFRDLLVAGVVKKPDEILDMSAEELNVMQELLALSSPDQATLMLAEMLKTEADVRNSSAPRIALEMSLMKVSFLSALKPVGEVIERLNQYRRSPSLPQPAASEPLTVPQTVRSVPAPPPPVEEEDEGPAAKEAPAQEQAAASPAPATETASLWQRTVERLDPPLASKFAHAGIEITGDELLLTLNGGHAVFADDITRNIKPIEQILFEESGRKIRIRLVTAARKTVKKKDLKEKVMNEPAVRKVLDLFEGRIVDVTPLEQNHTDNDRNGGDDV